jgi:multiple sugar transport system ATP-binding protein
VSGSIKWVEHLGDQNHLHVTLGDTDIVTLADPDSGLDVGDIVAIEFARPLYFGADGRRIAG